MIKSVYWLTITEWVEVMIARKTSCVKNHESYKTTRVNSRGMCANSKSIPDLFFLSKNQYPNLLFLRHVIE